MEELLVDVVGQLVRLPFKRIIAISDLNTIKPKLCLERGHLLLIELEVWGEERQLFVNDAIKK